MNTYISVNVVSQSLILLKLIQQYHCQSRTDIALLKLPYGVHCDSALAFLEQCRWISTNDSIISFTEVGNTIITMFNGDQISTSLWRLILGEYISVCKPAWAKRISFGRKQAYLYMNEEEQRCFLEAELISSYDDSVIKWWDSLAETERKKSDETKDAIGRKGEKLTVLYEEKRTGLAPDWRSIETNLEGYDILSYVSANSEKRILIEVKTSSLSVASAEAVISRNEWDTANRTNNIDRYYFYFWCICDSLPQLAVINAKDIVQHVPKDGDHGRWENMTLPFSLFNSQFKPVDYLS